MKNKLTSAAINLEGLLFALIIGSVSLLTSCRKDDNALPSVKSNKAMLASNEISARESDPFIAIIHKSNASGLAPAYSVAVMDDGSIIYDGQQNVGTLGKVEFNVGKELVNELRNFALEQGFKDLPDEFPGEDASPTTITRVMIDSDLLKTVIDHGIEVPENLAMIQQVVEEKLGIRELISAQGGNADEAIILKRAPDMYGKGRAFSVVAYSDGSVIYEGISGVQVLGQVRIDVGSDRINELLRLAEEIGFVDLRDVYDGEGKGLESSYTLINFSDGSSKSVREFSVETPDALYDLQRKIEDGLQIAELAAEK